MGNESDNTKVLKLNAAETFNQQIKLRNLILDNADPEHKEELEKALKDYGKDTKEQKKKIEQDFNYCFERFNTIRKLHRQIMLTNTKIVSVMNKLVIEDSKVYEDFKKIDIDGVFNRYIFTFDELPDLDDRSIQKVFRYTDEKDLAVAMIGAPISVKCKIYRNMSNRAAYELRKESVKYYLDSSVKEEDVLKARYKIVSIVLKLIEEEEIHFTYSEKDYFYN